jgi:hypothetical protein
VQYDILGNKVLSMKQVKKLPEGFGTKTIRAMQQFLSANGSYCFGSGHALPAADNRCSLFGGLSGTADRLQW